MARNRTHRLSNWLYHSAFFARFYERIAGRFAIELLWDEFHHIFLSRIAQGGTLLEIGAGPGLVALKTLKHRPDLKIIVTDYSPEMLSLARDNLTKAVRENSTIAEHSDQLTYTMANAMDLSQFANSTIDGVYSMGAVKHFPDPALCLQQMQHVLAEHGRMYIVDSCSDGTYAGTRKIIARLGISPVAGMFLCPILHVGLKKESPSATEIELWQNAFKLDGEARVDFPLNGSMFEFVYQKQGSV